MKTLISFLRGVNMAGHNKIKMAELADLYNALGFSDVETFIQSGNVIFSYEHDLNFEETSAKIEKRILEKFNYSIPVMLRSTEEMKHIIAVNPFLTERDFDPAKAAVIFLNKAPGKTEVLKASSLESPPDKFWINGSEIFIYCPNGFAKTKLYSHFFEKKIDVIGTARNWKTITTILSLAEKR